MATPPRKGEVVKATPSDLQPGGLVTQTPPMVSAAGGGVDLEENSLIWKQMFDVQWDFTRQCIFQDIYRTFLNTPSPLPT